MHLVAWLPAMLHQELPRIESTPLDGWERWLVPALAAAAGVTGALVLLLLGQTTASTLALVGGVILGVALSRRSPALPAVDNALTAGPDFSLVGAALGLSDDPVALTDGEGTLLVVNSAYRERFGNKPPPQLAVNGDAAEALALVRSMAWRDGAGCVAGVETSAGQSRVEVDRVGALSDRLLWRFPSAPTRDPLSVASRRIGGRTGAQLASAGVLAAVVDAKGELLVTNSLFADRAIPSGHAMQQARFGDLVEVCDGDQMRLLAEGEAGRPFRAVHVPAPLSRLVGECKARQRR